MIAFSCDGYGPNCRHCTWTCNSNFDGCGGTADTREVYWVYTYEPNCLDQASADDSPTPKQVFWEHVRSLFPPKPFIREKPKQPLVPRQVCFRKAMFAKSGKLPRRIRKARCNA